MKPITHETGRSLAIHPSTARAVRLMLEAAGRRLASLEQPSGYRATHDGLSLLAEARRFVAEAAKVLDGGV